MKKIFLFILLFICLKSFGQYPSKQTLGSPTSKLEVLGGVHAVKGLINGRYADTTAANLGYIDSYHGSQIFTTTDKILWLRDSVLNKWVNLSAGGSATDTTSKWVNNITKNAGGDSLIYYINTTRYAVSDPGSIYTASQGLTLTGSNFTLGGTVSSNRVLTVGSNWITLDGTTRSLILNADGWATSNPSGGGGSIYIQPGAGSAFPGITYLKGAVGSGTTLVATGVHWVGTAGGNKHHFISDMRDSIQYVAIESAGTHMAAFGTLWNGHHTDLGAKGKISIASTGFLDHAGNKGYLDNYKSTYLRDSLMYQFRSVVTDSTGGDLLWRSRTAPYEVKQISIPALAALVGGGGTQGLQDVIDVDPIIATNSTISLAANLFIGDNIGVDFKNSTSTLELFGPTIKLNRGWSGAAGTPGLPAGASTDSVVTINQADGQVRMRAASSFSGSGEINTGSNLGGGLANYSTKVGVDLQFNSFFASDFDLGSNLISIDYVNGQKASNTVSGFVSATTQTFSAGKTFNAPLNVKDAGGAYLQGFQIINSASVAQTSILHEGGSFFIGLATAASGADASGDFIQRIRAYEETATGTNPIIELGDNDLRINHDGTANYAGNYGIATAVPTEKLHVTGNIRFSGALMPNNTAGTAGQVLTSAGAGTVPTWTTPSAGGSGVLYYRDPLFEPNDSTLGVDSTKMKIWPGSIIAGATMSLGSDASWDLYTRNASGVLERVANGTTGQYFGANTGAKATWQTPPAPTFQQVLTAGSTITANQSVSNDGSDNFGFYGFANFEGTATNILLNVLSGSGTLRFDNDSIIAWNSNVYMPTLARSSAARNVMVVADSSTGLLAYQTIPSGGGSGTVTATGGALTANSIVLGAGTTDTKVVSGIVTDGVSNLTLTKTGATAATVYDAVIGTNTTTASSGNQMLGPAFHSVGQGWKTTATAASQEVNHRWYTLPIQGTTNPTSSLVFESSVNAGAYTVNASIGSNGFIGIGTTTPIDLTNDGPADRGIYIVAASARPTIGWERTGGGGARKWALSVFSSGEFGWEDVTGGTTPFILDAGAPTNSFHILGSGNTGIGIGAPTSKLHVNGSFATAYVAKTATYPITAADYTIECTSGTFTTTLPTAVGITGRIYVITNSGSGVITVATTSSQTFVNVTATPTTLTLSQFGTATVQSNGANWLRISSL